MGMLRLAIIASVAVSLLVVFQQTGSADASDTTDVTPAGAAEAPTSGDADCSGDVTAADIVELLKGDAGISAAACWWDADVNCDGGPDFNDALLVALHLADVPTEAIDDCDPVGSPREDRPTSAALIAQGLADGAIDEETAILYEVFATFGDSRLPEEYRGAATDEDGALRDAALVLDTLSPATQAALEPFFIAPYAPGSWLELDTIEGGGAAPQGPDTDGWTTVMAAGGLVKVWAQDRYPGDVQKAETLAAEYTRSIWPELTGLMGEDHLPLRDKGTGINIAADGGDAALDVYLVHFGANGEFVNHKESPWCQLVRGYILLNSARPIGSETSVGMIQSAAHETMHGIQATYTFATGCWAPEYDWIEEATAEWAVDFVYPNSQHEHLYAPALLDFTFVPLDFWAKGSLHQYGAYLFPFSQVRSGKASFVPDIWAQFGSKNNMDAINFVLGGAEALEDEYAQFAVRNWNREPVDDYKKWDKLEKGVTPFGGTTDLGIEEITMDIDQKYLTAQYRHFKPTNQATFVEFKNTFPGDGIEHAQIWGIAKINGEWQEPEDWTDLPVKQWCREDPDENLQELVIVFANTDWDGKGDLKPKTSPTIEGSQRPCLGWRGMVTRTQTVTYSSGGVETTTDTGTILWELHDYSIPDGKAVACEADEDPCLVYYPTGEISWVYDRCCYPQEGGGGVPDCRETGTVEAGTGSIIPGDQQLILRPDDLGYTYSGYGFVPNSSTPGCGSQRGVGEYFLAPEEEGYFISSLDPKTIQGEYRTTGQGPYDVIVYTWHFTLSEE